MDIKDRVKLARKKINMTQKDFGELLNLSHSTITLIEQGKSNLTIQSLILICKECNVSADWILFGNEPNNELERNYHRLNPEERKLVDMIFKEALHREMENVKIGNL